MSEVPFFMISFFLFSFLQLIAVNGVVFVAFWQSCAIQGGVSNNLVQVENLEKNIFLSVLYNTY